MTVWGSGVIQVHEKIPLDKGFWAVGMDVDTWRAFTDPRDHAVRAPVRPMQKNVSVWRSREKFLGYDGNLQTGNGLPESGDSDREPGSEIGEKAQRQAYCFLE